MIEVTKLNKYFAGHHVLKDISFAIPEGNTVSIIGPSGSGKSTLIRCLNLLEKPQQGILRIGDIELIAPDFPKAEVNRLRTEVGMVFQSFNLFPHLKAIENVAQGLITVRKKKKKQALEEAEFYLTKVGLGDKILHYPSQLSGGQQQRVAIARSLAMQPKVILMDEPTSALDPELVQEVLHVIREIAKEKMTCVIVTHELSFAREISSEIIFIDKGIIIEQGKPDGLFNNPENPRTAEFLYQFVGRRDFDI